jgi:divalent metal cation (Fe/Co/Zn/Cd) transporter
MSTAPLPLLVRPSPEWLRLTRRAKRLSWTSLAWLTIEGTVSVAAGLAAGSVALVGFGLDSAIEGAASVIVIWRFTGGRTRSPDAERRAQRLVAASFFLLAPYVAAEAALALATARHPETSWVGVALAAGSLLICPWLGMAKRRLGARLGSPATAGEGRQNLLCAGLAAGVLLGLLANALWGLWWLDPAVALGIAAVAVREGVTSWRGESCACCAPARPLA